MATPPRCRPGRSALPAVAEANDRRGVGGPVRQRRRNLVRPDRTRLRDGYQAKEDAYRRGLVVAGPIIQRDSFTSTAHLGPKLWALTRRWKSMATGMSSVRTAPA